MPEQRCIKYVTALKFFSLSDAFSAYFHSFGLVNKNGIDEKNISDIICSNIFKYDGQIPG